ncbi:MAG: transposase [Phycisphaerales bacterium]|nr:MAG: transposase [Phycisphaerales bacterium]
MRFGRVRCLLLTWTSGKQQQMAAPYSQDLRDRVLAAYDRGMKTKEISTVFDVSPAWARRVKQRRREFGETTPRKVGNPGICKVDRTQLAELVRQYPDATLAELREKLGIVCGLSTICTALKKLGLSFIKRSSTPPSRIVRTWSRNAPNGVAGREMSMPGG